MLALHPVPHPFELTVDALAGDHVGEYRGDHRRAGERGVERDGDPHADADRGRADDQAGGRIHDEHLRIGHHQPESDDAGAGGRDPAQPVEKGRRTGRAVSRHPPPHGETISSTPIAIRTQGAQGGDLAEAVDQVRHLYEDGRQTGQPDKPADHEGQAGGPRVVGVQHQHAQPE